jgi:hypothetical protein
LEVGADANFAGDVLARRRGILVAGYVNTFLGEFEEVGPRGGSVDGIGRRGDDKTLREVEVVVRAGDALGLAVVKLWGVLECYVCMVLNGELTLSLKIPCSPHEGSSFRGDGVAVARG